MSDDWQDYIPQPIERFHGDVVKEFHKGAEFKSNEIIHDGVRYINGIEFNRLLAIFKNKIIYTYRLPQKAIPCSSKITSNEDRLIIENAFYEAMAKEKKGVKR